MNLLLSKLMPVGTALAAVAAVSLWLAGGPREESVVRVPGMDNAPTKEEVAQEPVKLEGTVIKGTAKPADIPGSWPGFRGEGLDNVVRSEAALAREWPPGGPPKLWQLELTEGYAAAAVLDGRVYVHDYDREAGQEVFRCLSLEEGGEIWRFVYTVKIKMNHGITRTVPAVTPDHVVGFGPLCHVICLDARTGEKRWMMDLVRQHGATVPPWYAGQCPLIEDGKAILAPGGPEALLMAVDCATGDILWKTPNPDEWKMTHASIVPVEYAGRRMYVYPAHRGVVGVSAEDGALLWKTGEWRISIATVPSPLPLPGGRLFLTGGYNAGSMI
ncbi:MAG: PQQ-binding-like beta-propeller repeat protein, partial [bacterium]